MPYQPPQEILEKYADVLINFALGGGEGIRKGDVVRIITEEAAKPFYFELYKAILKAGGHPLTSYLPDDDKNFNFSRAFYELASDEQIDFFPEKYFRGIADTVDHSVGLLCDVDKHALEGIDPAKIMRSGLSRKPYSDWLDAKENAGKFTWTLGLYGTEAMAKEAGMSLEEYWQQIINACFLEEADPIAKWREISAEIEKYRTKLNALPIDKLHVEGDDADLWVTLGEKRRWAGGGGRNIPSFEIFTSPDWRGTNGWIRFNQPLYRYGNMVTGIELKFKDGRVVESKAEQNEKVLKEMIATEGADKIGEFSLTDSRHSRITKFMAETLYDENIGGRYGNTHLALGKSYHDCYDGDPSKVDKEGWAQLGFNDSSVHTDMISTVDRTVTATMANGSTQVIYRDGKFQI